MSTQTGSTYISKSTIEIKIPTANLKLSSTASWTTVSLAYSYNDRQPEITTETGNTYVSETMKDSIEIPTANSRFLTTKSSIKVLASDCHSDRQPE